MLKKLLSAFLAVVILTIASSANVFARADNDDEKKGAVSQEKQIEKRDLASAVKARSNVENPKYTKKDTLAEYEKTKAQGRNFSTTTKVLIGVGVAAAVIGIVFIAARKGARDAGTPFRQ